METSLVLSDAFWADESPLVLTNTRANQCDEGLQQWLAESGELRRHVLFATSGSTGAPKWVALSKRALLASARTVNQHLQVCEKDHWLLALPTFHVGGFGILARAYEAGIGVTELEGKWDVSHFMQALKQSAASLISLVPTQVVDLIRANAKAPSSVRAVIVGGGALDAQTAQQARSLGWPILQSYGMTESCSQIATGEGRDGWLDVLPDWELRVNNLGVLEWKGDASLTAYVLKEGNHFTIQEAKNDGWFTTRDMVELDSGRLKFVRRADCLVKVLGELVDLSALERELSAQVSEDVYVVAIPEQRRGHILVAVSEASEEKLQAAAAAIASGVRALDRSVHLSEMPKSSIGKVMRKAVTDEVYARFYHR